MIIILTKCHVSVVGSKSAFTARSPERGPTYDVTNGIGPECLISKRLLPQCLLSKRLLPFGYCAKSSISVGLHIKCPCSFSDNCNGGVQPL